MAGEIYAAYFNLLKTIVGGGIVTFPSFFVTFGILPTVLFAMSAAALAFLGLLMLCDCARLAQSKEKTFSASLKIICPRIAKYFNAIVFVKCFGVSISYIMIVRSLMDSIAEIATGKKAPTRMLISLFGICMVPICAMKNMKALRFTSMLGIIGVFLCVAGSLYNLHRMRGEKGLPEIQIVKHPTTKWLSSVGQFVFTFTCHQNIFNVRAEIEHPTRKVMSKIIGLAIGTALFIYLFFGFIIYATYGDGVQNNVFMSFIDGKVKICVFLFYIILLVFSYPLQIYPSRECLTEWIMYALGVEPKEEKRKWIRIISAVLLIIATVSISLISQDIVKIQTLIGGTASTLMCNIIPVICIYLLDRKKTPLEIFASTSLIIYSFLSIASIFPFFPNE